MSCVITHASVALCCLTWNSALLTVLRRHHNLKLCARCITHDRQGPKSHARVLPACHASMHVLSLCCHIWCRPNFHMLLCSCVCCNVFFCWMLLFIMHGAPSFVLLSCAITTCPMTTLNVQNVDELFYTFAHPSTDATHEQRLKHSRSSAHNSTRKLSSAPVSNQHVVSVTLLTRHTLPHPRCACVGNMLSRANGRWHSRLL